MNPDLPTLRKNLLIWFAKTKRDFPWRKCTGWYEIFLSEIILQQTQVVQGLPYYQRFITRFPDIYSLANATEDEVLQLWAGLGYYSRAGNLLKTARIIAHDYHGHFPQSMKEALTLPGIGSYSAAAVLSIAFNKPFAVVDGNVIRVLSRLFLIREDTRQSRTHNEIQQRANSLLDPAHPGDFNEALMELGATVCSPQNPSCTNCPLSGFCAAFKQNQQHNLPYKSPPPAKRLVREYVCIIRQDNRYLLRQRPHKGLLARMWEFPTIAIDDLNLDEEQLQQKAEQFCGFPLKIQTTGNKMVHIYSHIRLEYIAVFFLANLTEEIGPAQSRWVNEKELERFAVHSAHRKIRLNN